jgi:hypothetical protein
MYRKPEKGASVFTKYGSSNQGAALAAPDQREVMQRRRETVES